MYTIITILQNICISTQNKIFKHPQFYIDQFPNFIKLGIRYGLCVRVLYKLILQQRHDAIVV